MILRKDPWLEHEDENPNQITKITEDIFRYYLPYDECLNCQLTRSPEVPDCYRTCKLIVRPSSENRCKPVVDTRTKVSNSDLAIYLTRSELVWNYYNDYNFIFRGRRKFELLLHHKNTNPLDDRFENLCLLTYIDHKELHFRLEEIQQQIRNLKREKRKGLLKVRQREYRDLLMNVTNSERAELIVATWNK